MSSRNPRQHTNDLINAVDEGLVDKDYLISALLNALSDSEVHQCLLANDILLDEVQDD